jgi:hypothetical protein
VQAKFKLETHVIWARHQGEQIQPKKMTMLTHPFNTFIDFFVCLMRTQITLDSPVRQSQWDKIGNKDTTIDI